MTKPKTQVLAVNLGVGDGAIDVAQIIADFVQRPVVMVTSDGKEVTIAPRALDLGALARHVKARSALTWRGGLTMSLGTAFEFGIVLRDNSVGYPT